MKNSIVACILLFLPAMSQAQFYQEDVVKKAMEDEMQNNMENMRLENEEGPFFISYTIMDGLTIDISASLGSIVSSTQSPAKGYNVRLLAGSYEFNDESFDGESDRSLGFTSIELPSETDYFGIRRALWASTDLVYKSATKLYNGHENQVKSQNKPLDQIPHRSFAKTPVVEISETAIPEPASMEVLEAYGRQLSAVFLNYPEIDFSAASLDGYYEVNYFLSSEGSYIKQAKSVLNARVYAIARTAEGQPVMNQVNFFAESPEGLPAIEEAVKQVGAMADELLASFRAPAFEDSYYGPVLFSGTAAASLLSRSVNLSAGGLKDADFIPSSRNFLYNSANGPELRPGKKVASDGITIKALSKLTEYNGTALAGAFTADSEGVVPSDELVLVENGVVKNLLGDRTITRADQQSTGHSSGVGVLMISSEKTNTEAELKQQLIEKAKSEGLEFALLVKDVEFGVLPVFNVYRVSVADGSETLLRSALIRQADMKILRKIAGASEETIVYHAAGLDNPNFPTSVISPGAILVDEMEIERGNNPNFNSTPYVKNPLVNE